MDDHQQNILYARIHRALREFPRYNNFLDRVSGLELSPPESHILVEVGGPHALSFGELCTRIGLEKTAMSKLVAKMQRRGHLKVSTSPDDARIKILTLTSSGKNLLLKFDRLADQRLLDFDQATQMKKSELRRLNQIVTSLADVLLASPSVHREKEHILRPSIRRLTRAFNLLGRRAMGSALNTLEWQILLTLCENTNLFTPSALCEQLSTTKSAVAVALAELERQGYVMREQKIDDGRVYHLRPKQSAFNLARTLELQAIKSYQNLTNVSREEVEIIERWIRGAAYHFHIARRGLTIKRLTEQSELSPARELLARFYLSNKHLFQIPEVMLARQGDIYGLYANTKLSSVVEFKPGKSREIVNFATDQTLSSESLRAFVLAACDRTLASPVIVPDGPFAYYLKPHKCMRTALGMLIH